MTAEEFLHGPLWLCKAYRKAWRERQEAQYVREWREGQYVAAAVASCLSKYRYPEKPLYSMADVDAQMAEERARREGQMAVERMKAKVAAINERIRARIAERGSETDGRRDDRQPGNPGQQQRGQGL